MPAMSDAERLVQLFLSQHPCVTIQTAEEEVALAELGRAAVELGVEFWVWSTSTGLYEASLSQSKPVPDTAAPAPALYKLTTFQKPAILVLLDLCGHLKDERLLRLLRDLIRQSGRQGAMVVLLGVEGEIPAAIRSLATPFDLSLPDLDELESIVKAVLRRRNEQGQFQVDLQHDGLATIVRNLRGLTARQARQVVLDAIGRDRRFDLSDVNKILAEKRKQFQTAGLLEYIESPVDLSEIGGLSRLKEWLKQREKSLSEEAINFGLPPPRGLLMLGMQGAGKSLSAKAVATSWQRPLLRLDVGALYDKYIGESEHRLRDALRQAEMMSPIVLWIDEIEKGFASAASQSTDGGLSKRMFGSLLTWMQEHRSPVFLIATANDIEALPPELLRKGRFDEIFFVDLPALEGRREILAIHIAKRKRNPAQFDLDTLAESCAGFSGAEIEQAIIAGLCEAFAAGQELETSHVSRAIKSSPPLSVTMAERVEALRQWARGRCMPAD
jgi:SpoVK/Ycf46/Vps4 family AAA+-type ATPase